ncbi:hypothetical protein [Xanthomonas graminis]|uniref:Uncharacterized protein n=1 Tax=Xanthomonas graminis pv. phlei TaxID=487906 RepID=A0A0K2ZJ01_9XANT|nr:hypothetical protein [Xanthomonas translucens]UKE66256.1 hypothetical protein KM547_02680 [Xanthomonas translucens pv. phlei]CTP83345.1 hypothetical protein XTPLMG730_0422 [Xanthomonas translucens pv. phlei]
MEHAQAPQHMHDMMQKLLDSATPLFTEFQRQLARLSPEAMEAVAEAIIAGHRRMLCLEVDSPLPAVHLVTIGPDQQMTQHISLQFPIPRGPLN